MKLGIYFREAEIPQGGGGGAFESALIDSFLNERLLPPDDVTFFGPAGSAAERMVAAGYRHIEIPVQGLSRAWLRLPRPGDAALRSVRSLSRQGRVESGFDRRIAGSGIDLLWCLGPDVPSLEVPFVITVWDLQHRLQPFFPEVSADGVWDRRERYFATTMRRAAFVVTGTEAGKEEVERFYGIDPARIVTAPHPTPRLPDPAGTAMAHDLSNDYVFYPAQFWPHKNHVGLLHALALLRDEGLSLDLVLTGSDWGGNQHYVERTARELGLTENVHFLGFVPRHDLAALYRGAACLAYMSYFGPENLPPLEAFSCGCPVVAADVPGAQEQLGDAAILADPSDESAIAGAIRRVATDESFRGQLVERGRERAARATPRVFIEAVMEAISGFERIRRNWPTGAG